MSVAADSAALIANCFLIVVFLGFPSAIAPKHETEPQDKQLELTSRPSSHKEIDNEHDQQQASDATSHCRAAVIISTAAPKKKQQDDDD